MRGRQRRRWRPAPPPVQILLDRADDLRVLRALEAYVAARRGAILVRPTPGCYGRRSLCPAILEGAGLTANFQRGWRARSIHEQTVSRLRRLPRGQRVHEVYVLRAHTVGGWDYLAQLAQEIGAALILVVHELEPCPTETRLLRLAGVRVAAPRVLHLTTDRRALEVGLPPVESWLLDPSIPTLWLPAVPAWPPIRRRLSAPQGAPRLAGRQEVSVAGRFC
jgi:hypothetical protein